MIDDIIKLKEQGLSIRQISEKLGISKSKVGRLITKEKLHTVPNGLSQNDTVPLKSVPKTTVPSGVPPKCPNYATVHKNKYSYDWCDKYGHVLGGKYRNCMGEEIDCPFLKPNSS